MSWPYGSDRLGSAVIDATLVVAAKLVIKRASANPLKVVVYTPLVTVPALPLMEPMIVCVNVLEPVKVLLSTSSVDDALELTPQVVAVTLPDELTVRHWPALPPKPDIVRLVVDAVPKYPVPLTVSAVDDAYAMVSGVVVALPGNGYPIVLVITPLALL